VEGLGTDAGRLIRLELQNENLVALERGRVLASVPDLISVLDSETADAIVTERVAYGQRVTVIAFACDPVWRTEKGIAVAGPRALPPPAWSAGTCGGWRCSGSADLPPTASGPCSAGRGTSSTRSRSGPRSWTAGSSSTAGICPRWTPTPSRGSSARSGSRPTG